MTVALPRAARLLRSLARDRSGLAMMEFALTIPFILGMAGYGTEVSFLSLTSLRVSQAAINLADNASRVGIGVSGGVTQLREADINDVLQGTRLESAQMKLTERGRIILSSLENVRQAQDTARTQRIHWQRCLGQKSGTGYDSRYPVTNVNAGTTVDTAASHPNEGIAKPAALTVDAPNDSGVMVVEVNYEYRPLFGTMFVSTQTIRYVQSLVVRDNRDFTRIYNPSPAATASTCDKFTS